MMHFQKVRLVLEQLLFSAHVFVLVILLAESRLVLPDWLYVVGRMHPLLLHFPIVLLLLAVLLLLFPQIVRTREDQLHYSQSLLLLGCCFSAITVVAGLFLSLESGSAEVHQSHKWTGLAVFWLSSLLYIVLNRFKKQPHAQKILASIVGVLVVITGHLGSTITHGENFITAPLNKEDVQLVSLEEAEVFAHVIQPILQNKCVGCHKASKQKGDLRLDFEQHILTGGESGPAVVPGDLENSLLVHHILLSVEDDGHMPPKGKPQLTEEEKELITSWVASGGDFGKKLLTYSPEAPIFQLASQKFENLPKTYTFDAADPEKIALLNNFYRKVVSLGAGSPAVSVSYFSRQNFNAASIKELSAIKTQVVSLNLNNMPIRDTDMELLSDFVHLENLYLNFAEIQGEGTKHLLPLENLLVLSLSGNTLDETALVSLEELKGLEKLFIWNCGLSEEQISKLKKSLPQTYIETGFADDGTIYQLNPPTLEFENSFFHGKEVVEILHPIKSTSIYYTLDGSLPDSSLSILYREPLLIDSNSILRTRAFAEGWIGSSEAGAEFIKAAVRPTNYSLQFPPSDRYKGDLVNSLFDGQKGRADVWDLSWLGFNNTYLDVEMEFANPQDINSLELSIWYNPNSWFFPPGEVEIWAATDENQWELKHQSKLALRKKSHPAGLERIPLPFNIQGVERLKLIARPALLPPWHTSAGQKAWIMIDEVVIN